MLWFVVYIVIVVLDNPHIVSQYIKFHFHVRWYETVNIGKKKFWEQMTTKPYQNDKFEHNY
jgi:hypothetical protein